MTCSTHILKQNILKRKKRLYSKFNSDVVTENHFILKATQWKFSNKKCKNLQVKGKHTLILVKCTSGLMGQKKKWYWKEMVLKWAVLQQPSSCCKSQEYNQKKPWQQPFWLAELKYIKVMINEAWQSLGGWGTLCVYTKNLGWQ